MALGTENISTTLVGTTLGTSSRDVGTLCTHPNINKWSRWKPIRVNTIQPITGAQIMAANCGLDILEFTTINNLINFYRTFDGNDYKFEYLKPRGGAVEPYRLGDFRNYDHEASKWYYTTGFNQNYFSSDTSYEFRLSRYMDTSIEWRTVGLNFHSFGLVFVSAGTLNNQKVALNHTTLYDIGGTRVNIDLSNLPDGDYDIFAFIFYRLNDVIQHYVPIEGGFLGTAQLRENKLEVLMTGAIERSGPLWKVPWGLTIKNFSQTQQTLENCVVELRYDTSTPGSTLRNGEERVTLGTIQIPGGQSYTNWDNEFSSVLGDFPITESGAYLYFGNTTNTALNKTFAIKTPVIP